MADWNTPRAPGRRSHRTRPPDRTGASRRPRWPRSGLPAGSRPGGRPGGARHRRTAPCHTSRSGRPRWRPGGIPGVERGPVVPVGGAKGGLVEALGTQPALMGQRPGIPAPPGAGRGPAGTCPADAGRGSGLRPCQPGPGTGHGRLLPGRWGCGWPPVPRPGAGAPAAGSPAGRSWALSPGALGIGDGAITWQRTSMRCSSRARS
jgi:hypothetical protein